jgi:glycosyltransferase involved in cell wall biosynthesis
MKPYKKRDKLMRVAIISHGYKPRIGGAERQLGSILPLLKSRGIDVYVFTRKLTGTSSFEIIDGIPIHRISVPGPKAIASILFSVSVLAWMKKISPDLIHAHELISPATSALWAHRLMGIPIILTPHSSGSEGEIHRVLRKPLGKSRLDALRDEAAAFITISKEIDTELEIVGVQEEKRIPVPNGVDTSEFAPVDPARFKELRCSAGIPTTSPVAIFVGRLVPIKRVDRLLSIWPIVRNSHPEAILLIVGDGPLEDTLINNCSPGIKFLGSTPEVSRILPVANVFVLSSESEGLPVSLLEAMSCGLPVIAPRIGGIPEVVENNVHGYIYPEGNQDDLLNCIQTSFSNLERTALLGNQARKRILTGYSLELMADKLISLYEKVLQKQR